MAGGLVGVGALGLEVVTPATTQLEQLDRGRDFVCLEAIKREGEEKIEAVLQREK
jgi:hypothetical protein